MAAAPLPPQLALAERWIQRLGMSTRPTEGTDPSGAQIRGLEIHRGPFVLVAFSPPSTTEPFLILKVIANLPASMQAAAGRLGEETRRQLLDEVFAALQSNPRSGFQVVPEGATDFSQIQQISLEQVMRLEEGDPGSFNRLSDGVQELVTGLTRVTRRIANYLKV